MPCWHPRQQQQARLLCGDGAAPARQRRRTVAAPRPRRGPSAPVMCPQPFLCPFLSARVPTCCSTGRLSQALAVPSAVPCAPSLHTCLLCCAERGAVCAHPLLLRRSLTLPGGWQAPA
jgi:hypothetical protein